MLRSKRPFGPVPMPKSLTRIASGVISLSLKRAKTILVLGKTLKVKTIRLDPEKPNRQPLRHQHLRRLKFEKKRIRTVIIAFEGAARTKNPGMLYPSY